MCVCVYVCMYVCICTYMCSFKIIQRLNQQFISILEIDHNKTILFFFTGMFIEALLIKEKLEIR